MEMSERVELRLQALLSVGIAGLLFLIFHFHGNSAAVENYSGSAFKWMVALWSYKHYDFSHGWLIPWVSLFLVLRSRREICLVDKRIYWPAYLLVILALLGHAAGLRTQQTRVSLLALITLLWSVPCYAFGRNVGRLILFPCCYLLFCIPFTFLDGLTFGFRMVAARMSAALLNGVGIDAVRRGTSLLMQGEGGFALEVADACSGLKYLVSLAALTAVYSYVAEKGWVKRWLLFLGAVPLAMAGNVARVFGVAFVAVVMDRDLAVGMYHDYSGYIVFGVAVILMMFLRM